MVPHVQVPAPASAAPLHSLQRQSRLIWLHRQNVLCACTWPALLCFSSSCTTAVSADTCNAYVAVRRQSFTVHCRAGCCVAELLRLQPLSSLLWKPGPQQPGAHLCPAGWRQSATAPSHWACSAGGACQHPPAASCKSPLHCAAVATARTCTAQQAAPWPGHFINAAQ